MLEGVTLAQVVELVVEVLVDLASGTVTDEQATENTHAAHPENLAISITSLVSSGLYNIASSNYKMPEGAIESAYLGIRASLVPLRLPRPR